MSTTLLVLALLVALVSVPTVAGLTAWGLAGGDGTPANALVGILGGLVAIGSVYNVVTCWLAFWDIAPWQWWLMWVCPAAGVLGIALTARHADESPRSVDWLVGLAMQASLAVPAVLVWWSGAVA